MDGQGEDGDKLMSFLAGQTKLLEDLSRRISAIEEAGASASGVGPGQTPRKRAYYDEWKHTTFIVRRDYDTAMRKIAAERAERLRRKYTVKDLLDEFITEGIKRVAPHLLPQ